MLKLTAATAALCLILSAPGCADRRTDTGGAVDPGAAGGVTDRTGNWGTEQRTAPATDAGTFGQHQGTGAAPITQPGTAHDPQPGMLGPGTGTATEPGTGARLEPDTGTVDDRPLGTRDPADPAAPGRTY